MKDELLKKKCVPCEGGIPAVPRQKSLEYLKELPDWLLSEDAKSISSQYVMEDFMAAVEFINAVARLAEAEGHHPDIHLTGYRRLKIELSTHAIGGLSENDFILAAKMETLRKKLKKLN